MAIKLKMVRRGSFAENGVTTENMCGVTQSSNPTYNYVCEIECGTILDSHGFMIDQLDVDRYFQVKFAASLKNPQGVTGISCERMAIVCLEDVKYMVESHMMKSTGGSEIHRIAVTIYFNDTAAMTAEWKATDENVCGTTGRKPNRTSARGQRKTGEGNPVLSPAGGRSKKAVVRQPDGDSEFERIYIGGGRYVLSPKTKWRIGPSKPDYYGG
jgi:hypothetical protein